MDIERIKLRHPRHVLMSSAAAVIEQDTWDLIDEVDRLEAKVERLGRWLWAYAVNEHKRFHDPSLGFEDCDYDKCTGVRALLGEKEKDDAVSV